MHDHNKPRSTASATSNSDNENTQNPRQNLEEEIRRLKNKVGYSTCYTNTRTNFTSPTIKAVTTKDNSGMWQ